jgi:ribonuclease HII
LANLNWERTCWRDDYRLVVGIDEAGRGALAGPIVAAAVIMPPTLRLTAQIREINDSKQLTAQIREINDSKQLPEQKRERLAVLIRSVAVTCATGQATAQEIDELGIARANRICMERAVEKLDFVPDFALIDALTCEFDLPQIGLIDGDAISVSIAAASILAKTERDRYMREQHSRDDRYRFDRHVGYGTALHLTALRIYGPCAVHRLSFHGVLPDRVE